MRVGILSLSSLLRHGLIAMLAAQREIAVAWQAEDVGRLNGAGGETPDVILMDADNDALDRAALEKVKAQFPKSRIVMLYAMPSEELMVETLLAGARGCLSKARDGAIFVKAICCVARDEVWANRRVTAQALQRGARANSHGAPEAERLSPREWEVFSQVAVGKRNREIAEALCISEQTVKRHLYSVYRKLNVPSRLEAGLLFYRMNSAPKESRFLPPAVEDPLFVPTAR